MKVISIGEEWRGVSGLWGYCSYEKRVLRDCSKNLREKLIMIGKLDGKEKGLSLSTTKDCFEKKGETDHQN